MFHRRGKGDPLDWRRGRDVWADKQNLYGWMAKCLAEKLQVPPDSLPLNPTLNEVVCRHLLRGGARNVIYTRLQRLLRDDCPEPGTALRELADFADTFADKKAFSTRCLYISRSLLTT